MGHDSSMGYAMKVKEVLQVHRNNISVLGGAGTIGLHMVSGPLVGFAMGYGLDMWLGTSPWLKIIFLIVGFGAGFKNVYDDTRKLLRQIQAEDAQKTRPKP